MNIFTYAESVDNRKKLDDGGNNNKNFYFGSGYFAVDGISPLGDYFAVIIHVCLYCHICYISASDTVV